MIVHQSSFTRVCAAAAALIAGLSAGAEAAPPGGTDQCFRELARDGGREFACEYPAWLTEKERADIEKLTRGYFKDARCVVSIRIERARIAQAVVAPDLEFQAPAQPVVCDVTTSSSQFSIKGTFAPRVVFKGGEAVDGSPGLANVEGVNKYLAWPVVEYVNRSPGIRGEMLKMVNAYRAKVRARREAMR